MRFIPAFVAVLFIAMLFAGCSVLAPQLETPQLSIVGVEVLKSDIFEQRLKVRMRVQNPNARELDVQGISYALEVAGERLGRGVAAGGFLVPSFGESEFDMHVTANVAGTLLRLLGNMDKSDGKMPEAIDYRIVGKVSLAKGFLRSIPFDEKGSFKLN